MNRSSYSQLGARDRGVIRVLAGILVLNLAVIAGKLGVGIAAGNLTVVADGLHSVMDGLNNVLGMLAIWLAARPADPEHPYGHRKFENIAAMLVGGFMVLMCWEVLGTIVGTVWGQLRGTTETASDPIASPIFIAVIAATIVINIFVARYESRRGVELDSAFLKADAAHTRSDVMVAGLGLSSLLTARFAWWLDPLLAMGVLAFLVHAAWEIIAENLPAFTDRARLDPEEVRGVVESVPGVQMPHAIRSHGAPHDIHLDLHIVVPAELTAVEVGKLEEEVRAALLARFPEVTLVGIQHETELPEHPGEIWKE